MTAPLTTDERAELEALRAAAATPSTESGLTFKISPKGCVMVLGLWDKHPVTLYKDLWRKLMGEMDSLEDFIVANDAALKNYK